MRKPVSFLLTLLTLAACSNPDLPASPTPSATVMPPATEMPLPTATPLLTSTPLPTDTLVPSETPTEMPTPTPTEDPMAIPDGWTMVNEEIAVDALGTVMEYRINQWLRLRLPEDIDKDFANQFRIELGENNLPTIKINFLELGDLEIAEYQNKKWHLKEFEFRYSPEDIAQLNANSKSVKHQVARPKTKNGYASIEYAYMFFSGLRVTNVGGKLSLEIMMSHRGGYAKIAPNSLRFDRQIDDYNTDSHKFYLDTVVLEKVSSILALMNTSSRIGAPEEDPDKNAMVWSPKGRSNDNDAADNYCKEYPANVLCQYNGFGDIRYADGWEIHDTVTKLYSYQDLSHDDWDSFPTIPPNGWYIYVVLHDDPKP